MERNLHYQVGSLLYIALIMDTKYKLFDHEFLENNAFKVKIEELSVKRV